MKPEVLVLMRSSDALLKVAVAVFLVAAAVLWMSPAKAATISVSPASQSIVNGDSVDVSIVISGLGDGAADSLGAFDLNLTFDNSILSYTAAAFGDPVLGDQLSLGGSGTYTAATPGAGLVNLVQLSFDPVALLNSDQAGSFVLAVLSFDAVGLGDSVLDFSGIILSDASGAALSSTASSASISVIPVPAAMWLFLSALGVLRTLRIGRSDTGRVERC